jgi:hypothetical protein
VVNSHPNSGHVRGRGLFKKENIIMSDIDTNMQFNSHYQEKSNAKKKIPLNSEVSLVQIVLCLTCPSG